MNNVDNSDFSSISPSAISLLETRSYSSIPFAKESFKIISQSNSNELNNGIQLPKGILLRIMHFEARYRSLDKGIRELGYNKILEFSSGYSFRGLEFCKNPNVQYIDTDLPNIIGIKKILLSELTKRYCDYQPNNLSLKSMNALNEKEFLETISIFNNGPISIVNEGLLMYLTLDQKEHLSKIIHKILSKYSGYWITADIYRKGKIEGRNIDNFYKQNGQEFLKKHNVENNKFTSFAHAKEFFSRCGFEIYTKIEMGKNELSSSKLLPEDYALSKSKSQKKEKTRETWILKPI